VTHTTIKFTQHVTSAIIILTIAGRNLHCDTRDNTTHKTWANGGLSGKSSFFEQLAAINFDIYIPTEPTTVALAFINFIGKGGVRISWMGGVLHANIMACMVYHCIFLFRSFSCHWSFSLHVANVAYTYVCTLG
jgi:hypothetical protein